VSGDADSRPEYRGHLVVFRRRGGVMGRSHCLSFSVVAGNTLLRPLVNDINRLPIDTHTTEARYRVHVVTDHRKVSAARDILDETLEKVGYPIPEIETLSETETQVELAAVLVPSSADPAVLDAVVAQLEKAPPVYSATWSVSTKP
jgi:putative Mg2+ transporter-C (MgtC) family protein